MRRLQLGLSVAQMFLCAPGVGAQKPAAPPASSARDSQTVVFVCEHGTVKSVVALAHFQRLVAQRGLPYRAVSRGTAPDASLPGFMREGLAADGLSLNAFAPARFTERDLAGAVKIISFDQPGVAALVRDRVSLDAWDRLPSVTANYGVARDAIVRRVVALVDSLEKAHRRR